MKHPFVSFLIVLSLLLTSCINITEEIKLNEDGSGDYQLIFNFRGLYDLPSFEAIMKEMTWDGAFHDNGVSATIDTTIYFKDLIAGRRSDFEKPEFWDKVTMQTQFDMDLNILVFTINAPFDRLSEIDYFYQELSKIQVAEGEMDSEMVENNPLRLVEGALFELDKKALIRHPIEKVESKIDENQMQFLKQFMPNSTYRTIYHLPGKVKKSTIKNSIIDENKIVAEYPLLDIYEGETKLEGEIRFK